MSQTELFRIDIKDIDKSSLNIWILDSQPASHWMSLSSPRVDNNTAHMSPLSLQSGQHGLAPHTPDLHSPKQRAGQPAGPGQRLPQADGAGIPGAPGGSGGQPHGHEQHRVTGCGLPGQHGAGQEGQHLATAGCVLHLARHQEVRHWRPLLPRTPAPGD